MPRIGERGWIHSGVKVYDNTAAPTSWTDLDLSGVVGKNRALVFLKFKNRHAVDVEFVFVRGKSDTEDVAGGPAHAAMLNIAQLDEGWIAHTMMETDENGVIQWDTAEGNNMDVWVLGYIR